MQLTFEDLKIFVTVVKSGSYTKATRELSTTRTTISRKINKIEQILGNKLIIVNTYNFKLTELGQSFYNSVVDKVTSFELIMNDLSKKYIANEEITGDLRVQLPPMFSMFYISNKIPGFLKTHPNLNLAVFYSKDFEVDQIKNELDVLITNHIPSKQDQKIRKIFSLDGGLFCTQRYKDMYGIPETPEELNEHFIVGYSKEDYKLDKNIVLTNNTNNCSFKFDMPRRLMSNSENNTIYFINSNEVIAPLLMHKEKCIEANNLIRVLPDYSVKNCLNYYLSTNPFSNKRNVETFIEFIEECLEN